MRVPPWVVCVFPGVFLSSRVTGACPVTTDLIMRVNVRTTTTTTRNILSCRGARVQRFAKQITCANDFFETEREEVYPSVHTLKRSGFFRTRTTKMGTKRRACYDGDVDQFSPEIVPERRGRGCGLSTPKIVKKKNIFFFCAHVVGLFVRLGG